jgi:hypothetical protein
LRRDNVTLYVVCKPVLPTVTIELTTQPSTAQTFQLTADVGSASSFALSDGVSHAFANVIDGTYQVTLASSQTVGYSVGVSCDAASATTVGDTTTFDVVGANVTCTYTLTGERDSECDVFQYCCVKSRAVDELPTIVCPDPVVVDNAPHECNNVATFDDPTVMDSHPDQPTFSCDPASGSTFDVGENDVTCTVTDSAGQQGDYESVLHLSNRCPTVFIDSCLLVQGDCGR